MATSPSEAPAPSGLRFTVVGGGAPTPQEVAAIAAALQVVLAPPAEPPPVSRWRWSGRWWQDEASDWRQVGLTAHPSRR